MQRQDNTIASTSDTTINLRFPTDGLHATNEMNNKFMIQYSKRQRHVTMRWVALVWIVTHICVESICSFFGDRFMLRQVFSLLRLWNGLSPNMYTYYILGYPLSLTMDDACAEFECGYVPYLSSHKNTVATNYVAKWSLVYK